MKLALILLLCVSSTLSLEFFDSFFQWQKAEFYVTKDNTQGSSTFDAEINSGEKGMFLNIDSSKRKENSPFTDDVAYPMSAEGKSVHVMDYELMNCNFDDKTSWISKNKFEFKMRNFKSEKKSVLNYKIQVSFKLGSGIFGGVELKSVLKQLSDKCKARQAFLQKKLEDEAKAAEKKRIESELEKKKIEAEKKLQEERARIAEEQKKAEEARIAYEKAAEERKKQDEQKKKRDDEERAEKIKKLEEERVIAEKAVQEAKIQEEERQKKEEQEKKRIENEKLEEEEKQKELQRIENERIEAEKLKKLEDEKKSLEEEIRQKELKLLEEQKQTHEKAEHEKKKQEEERKQKQIDEEKRLQEESKKLEEEAQKRTEEEDQKKQAEDELKKKQQELEEQIRQAEEEKNKNEKKFLEPKNTLEIEFDCGFGNAIFITGPDSLFGSWETAIRLSPKNVEGKIWVFKPSFELKDGMIFKTVVAKWDEGETLDLENRKNKELFWELPKGTPGNKVMKFNDFVMSHKPNYDGFRK